MENLDPVNRRGEYAVITGGNRGIGFYTLLGLVSAGMKVIAGTICQIWETKWAFHSINSVFWAGCRDGRSKKQLFDKLMEAGISSESVEWISLDMASVDSVRNFAETILQKNVPISLLINNGDSFH